MLKRMRSLWSATNSLVAGSRHGDPSHSTAAQLDRHDATPLVAVIAAALAMRLWALGSESIWLDEATSIWLARKSITDMVRWTAVDIHPPLYYALLHVWLALGDGEVQVRLLSVLFGVCSVAVLYLLARRLFTRWVALASAALLATSPLHVWYSQETRMYAMLTLLGLVTSYCMVRALLDSKRVAWIADVVCAILSLYTHYYAFFILLFQNVVALYLVWRAHITRQTYQRWIVGQIVAGVAFVPWLPVLVNQVSSGGGSWVARSGAPGLATLAATATNFTLGTDTRWYPFLVRRLAYGVFGLLCLGGILSPLRRRQNSLGVTFSLIYLVVPIAVAWTVSQIKPLYSLRYLLPFLPAYYILIAQGLDMLRTSIGARPALSRAMAGLVWAGLLGVGVIGCAGSATHQQVTDWRSIAAHVSANAEPTDIVVFVPGWNAKPFDYYTRGRVALKDDTPIPIIAADAPVLAAEASRGRARLWLVQAEGHYADAQNILATYLDRTYTRLERQRYQDNIVVSLYKLNP